MESMTLCPPPSPHMVWARHLKCWKMPPGRYVKAKLVCQLGNVVGVWSQSVCGVGGRGKGRSVEWHYQRAVFLSLKNMLLYYTNLLISLINYEGGTEVYPVQIERLFDNQYLSVQWSSDLEISTAGFLHAMAPTELKSSPNRCSIFRKRRAGSQTENRSGREGYATD